MKYFKHESEVYSEDDIKDFITDVVFDKDCYDEYINEETYSITILGYDFEASEVFKNMEEYGYDREYEEKVDSLCEELSEELSDAEIGHLFDINGFDLVVCDENGNTEPEPEPEPEVKHIVLPGVYEVTGNEDKVFAFKVQLPAEEEGEEGETVIVELPISVAKGIAKGLVFDYL